MKTCLTTFLCLMLTPLCLGSNFDSKSATVSMDIALYASLTGLDSVDLMTPDTNGDQGAVYVGVENYQLESNGQVRVTVAGSNLKFGDTTVITKYALDGLGLTYMTEPNQVHLDDHSVSVSAALGEHADHSNGYSGTMAVTVSGF